MAHADNIEALPVLLRKLAAEIADLIDQVPEDIYKIRSAIDGELPDDEMAPVEIGETLTSWTLTARAAEALASSTLKGDIFDWVEQTPYLYHQIYLNAEPAGFARSRYGTDGKSLSHFNVSPRASRINEAFKMIDLNSQEDPVVASDPVVRLLEIHAYHILAIWLYSEARNESRVVVIDAGKRYEGLKRESFLTSDQFFEALKKGGPILGVA
jgi:hypothetical protein